MNKNQASIFPEGSGIFETLRTFEGRPQFLELHLDRSYSSAKKLKMPLPDKDSISSSLFAFLADNSVASEYGRLRIEFRPESDPVFSHSPYDPWVNAARLTITGSRVNEKSPLSGIKALPYVENVNLLKRAGESGFDEVIRFNSRNQVCEGAVSNLLFKINNEWVTPDLSSGCLPGITRGLCLTWFTITERSIHRDELADVESAFIISSLRGLQPAQSIGPHELVVDVVMTEQGRARMQSD